MKCKWQYITTERYCYYIFTENNKATDWDFSERNMIPITSSDMRNCYCLFISDEVVRGVCTVSVATHELYR